MKRESDIVFETTNGIAFVMEESGQYTVCKHSDSWTHSIVDSAYPKTADGLSIAIARAKRFDK